jgi:AhpC/TSA family
MHLTPLACALRRNGALKSGVQVRRASPPHNHGLCQIKSWLEQLSSGSCNSPHCLFTQVHFMIRSAGKKSYADADHLILVQFVNPSVTFRLFQSNSCSAKVLRLPPARHRMCQTDLFPIASKKVIRMSFATPGKPERRHTIRATAFRLILVAALCFAAARCRVAAAEPPNVGQKAPDFELHTPSGNLIQLSKQIGNSTVVLVVLRGFPGYQCPYCQKQVHDFIEHAADFATKDTKVILIYPGPPDNLRGAHGDRSPPTRIRPRMGTRSDHFGGTSQSAFRK